jgi:lipid II:glycine glycyltransferase (peptidoglycan interpeptide bridge formation enzyme)
VAGSLILHHQGFAAQHAHAIYREGRSVRAGDLLVWQSLSAMKEFGCTRYDFVTVEVAPPPGSREAGVREFKAKWGGTLLKTPAYRYLSPMRRFWHKLRAFAR